MQQSKNVMASSWFGSDQGLMSDLKRVTRFGMTKLLEQHHTYLGSLNKGEPETEDGKHDLN